MRKKELIELGITAGLVVILIIAFTNAFKRVRSRNLRNQAKPRAVELATLSVNPVNMAENKNLYNTLEQQVNSIELKRDPFTAAPIVSEKDLHSEVVLTGILWDKVKPLAIIDGEVVKKGESIGNRVIVDIKKDRVILSDGAVLSELKLEQ